MARHALLNWTTLPDNSGSVWFEPFTIAATNDQWGGGVWRFKYVGSRIGLRGFCDVPSNYAGGTVNLIIVWTATATTGNVVWDFDYRGVSGNDTESLDQTGNQESVSVTDAAPGAALRRLECSVAITSSNLAANDTLQFELFRDGTDGSNTMSVDAELFGAWLEYTP